MLVQLRCALVLIEHGEPELLDLLKVVVHLELLSKHWVQVVDGRFSATQLRDTGSGLKKQTKTTITNFILSV